MYSKYILIYNYLFMKAFIFASFVLVLLIATTHSEESSAAKLVRPIGATYIDKITQWWPPQKIAQAIGVPGYAVNTQYNYIIFAFWSCQTGALDIVNIWVDPLKYFSNESPFGTTKDGIQKNLKAKYNAAGKKVMISAFGATQFPTTQNLDPVDCAIKLGTLVNENNLDGVDIDWEDNTAMEAGTGQAWVISFQRKLRQMIPNHIITHAPQAPYFCKDFYKNGAYHTIHKQVGDTIDFYNMQFYNQGSNKYDTYQTLFLQSGSNFPGTSVNEIHKKVGVPFNKIIIGKPVTTSDASNTGWMDKNALAAAVRKGRAQLGWSAGFMYWQYFSDMNGDVIKTVMAEVKQTSQVNLSEETK